MSYEGYQEFLCQNGHYLARGCHDDTPEKCHCGAVITFRNSVDVTNGECEDEPWSMPAPKTETGWDDEWKFDHYGNRYAVKRLKYRPGDKWLRLSHSNGVRQSDG